MATHRHNTKWKHDRCAWAPIDLPKPLANAVGIIPIRGVLDLDTGAEIVLFLKDEPRNVQDLAQIRNPRMELRNGIVRTDFGPVAFLLFTFYSTAKPETKFTYELTLNPHDNEMCLPFMDLARQTHWHCFVLGPENEELRWYEFENVYGLGKALVAFSEAARFQPCTDFTKAKQQYEAKHTIEDLLSQCVVSDGSSNDVG